MKDNQSLGAGAIIINKEKGILLGKRGEGLMDLGMVNGGFLLALLISEKIPQIQR